MANGNSNILTAEQEMKLRQPIEDYVGKIQKKIDSLRADGTDKIVELRKLNGQLQLKETVPLQKEKRKAGLQNVKQSWKQQKQWKQSIKTKFLN